MKKIAHRFYRGQFTENSMEGLLYTIEKNVWAVETDIQLTKDDVPVIIHDELLDRTTNQVGYVKDWTLSELTKYCRLDNSENIMTLEDLLIQMKSNNIKIYLEIKNPDALSETQNILKKYKSCKKCVISSFHHKVILEAKHKNPLQRTMALFECDPIDPVGFVKAALADEVGLGFESISKELIKTLNYAKIETHSWTVNKKEDIEKARKYGLNGIFTDFE